MARKSSKAKSVGEIARALESRAPSRTAEDWDNVGLLAGDPEWKTRGAIVSVDLTREALDAAKSKGYRLIVNHHPCIFPKSRGLSRVSAQSSPLIFEAIREGIAVAAYHTNFDRCALEVVESVSRALGVKPLGRLVDHPSGSLVKLVVFVPVSHAEAVREAICEAGAGKIGNYDFCTFGALGEGTFRGSEGTDSFLGTPGQLEKAKELRLETILPRGLEGDVLRAMRKAHPYEEVAYDLYPVEQPPAVGGLVRGLGYGFWGDLEKPRSFEAFASEIQSTFEVKGFWLTGAAPKRVRRLGFVAGKGASFLGAARDAGCDLFITGEAGYHTALDGARKGMAVVELGHRESERYFLRTMEGWLKEQGLATSELNIATQEIWIPALITTSSSQRDRRLKNRGRRR